LTRDGGREGCESWSSQSLTSLISSSLDDTRDLPSPGEVIPGDGASFAVMSLLRRESGSSRITQGGQKTRVQRCRKLELDLPAYRLTDQEVG
jgi:hypothetical protein